MNSPTKTLKTAGYILIFLVMILIIIWTAGCQPTPEDLVVQNKNDDELMEAINNDSDGNVTSEPELEIEKGEQNYGLNTTNYKMLEDVVHEDTLVNGMELNIDADVKMPDTETLPVITYKRKQFTEEEIANAFEILTKGNGFYDYDVPMTTAQIDEQIVKVKYDYDDPAAIKMRITDIEYLHQLRDEELKHLNGLRETVSDTW